MPTQPTSPKHHRHLRCAVIRMALSFGRNMSLKGSAAFVLMLALPIATALAAAETGKFSSKLKNIQLCNGADPQHARTADQGLHCAD